MSTWQQTAYAARAQQIQTAVFAARHLLEDYSDNGGLTTPDPDSFGFDSADGASDSESASFNSADGDAGFASSWQRFMRKRTFFFSVRSTTHRPTRRVHLYVARKLRLRELRAQQRSAALAAAIGISSDDDADKTSVEQLAWTFSQWGQFVLHRRIRAASLFHRSARFTRAARAYRFGSERELQEALHTFASAVAENAADDDDSSPDVHSNAHEEDSAGAHDVTPIVATSPAIDEVDASHTQAGPIADADEAAASELPSAGVTSHQQSQHGPLYMHPYSPLGLLEAYRLPTTVTDRMICLLCLRLPKLSLVVIA